MKNITLYVLCLFFGLLVNAQSSKPEYFININPADCIGCINAMSNLEQFDELGIKYNFVFAKKSEQDSAFIKEEFF